MYTLTLTYQYMYLTFFACFDRSLEKNNMTVLQQGALDGLTSLLILLVVIHYSILWFFFQCLFNR